MEKPEILGAEKAGCIGCQAMMSTSIAMMQWPCFPWYFAAVV